MQVMGVLAVGRPGLASEEHVRVYCSEGPALALQEAASAFSSDDAVKVVGGPPTEWAEQASADADVVCSSAEYMMSAFVHDPGLKVDPTTVTPLYTRPSAILVRLGNPRKIADFPDLLKPGVRVMVVTGSGQTGLWEDMASRTGDIQTVRKLRDNIVCYAAHSTQAIRLWREKKEIDAWITWDIWHIPLRTEAKLISVSKEYRIFRLCSVALTSRAHNKPLAARFVRFLSSDQGSRIFASWGWTTPATDSGALSPAADKNVRSPEASNPAGAGKVDENGPAAGRHDIAVVCDVGHDTTTNGAGRGLVEVQRLVQGYESMGIPRGELHINVVVHGEAAPWLLKDGKYCREKRTAEGNPSRSLVERLLGCGVSVEVSGQEMKDRGWSREDLLDGVKVVGGAPQRIIDLQRRGYAYLMF